MIRNSMKGGWWHAMLSHDNNYTILYYCLSEGWCYHHPLGNVGATTTFSP